ncbi:NAD(P)-dependent dehydrogenase (short-subunit alcohol dehydrogenase family) [Rhodobium orientis]|uniref:3-oxoacyl-ACP reductase n=1 Tax=Rhodobium orientis TaxID=34017 RepID=A0A327JF08_9HYPH|nr:SDR family oxidoreductase [Rhodobium orientis]MBB4305548.1 NAD(P)-dependent dehydrogenase (short-subunit alcohol dehydrogenase family) [Rhodobium orientis]MBK5949143.1 3-oxoacyl-ACP reductase [Rhodobium orientis]RAI24685.1 3-oxoacyl-ACP reductase [Rhodobium orientis]
MSEPKIAVVTAAGSGMGADIARTLAARGYTVAISSSSDKAERLGAELGGFGMIADNLDPDACTAFIDAVVARYGRIDALVNSAGHGPKGPVAELTDYDWVRGMEVYFLATVRFIRLATPHLEKSGGAIVNLTGFSSVEPEAAFPTSSVFRAGLANFVKLYADQHAAKGIRINNVLPGFIDSLPPKETFVNRIPMARYGTVTEISETVAFLLSEGAGYITGQNIRVDGGFTHST